MLSWLTVSWWLARTHTQSQSSQSLKKLSQRMPSRRVPLEQDIRYLAPRGESSHFQERIQVVLRRINHVKSKLKLGLDAPVTMGYPTIAKVQLNFRSRCSSVGGQPTRWSPHKTSCRENQCIKLVSFENGIYSSCWPKIVIRSERCKVCVIKTFSCLRFNQPTKISYQCQLRVRIERKKQTRTGPRVEMVPLALGCRC